MSLFEHRSEEEEEPSRKGRVVLIGLVVVGCGVAAHHVEQARERLAAR